MSEAKGKERSLAELRDMCEAVNGALMIWMLRKRFRPRPLEAAAERLVEASNWLRFTLENYPECDGPVESTPEVQS